MKFFKKLSVPVILLTGLFTIALSVNAFKPTITEYGHTSITQKVISDNGYPVDFGGSGLVGLAQFQATLSGGSTITFSTEAAKHLVEGVQSNDWVSGSFGTPDVLGESGLAKEIEGVSEFRVRSQHCSLK